jgi:aminopeptidase N
LVKVSYYLTLKRVIPRLSLFFLFILCFCQANGQHNEARAYTRQDSLRGSVTPERAWWDVLHYRLDVSVDPQKRALNGTITIRYKVLEGHNILQIDLQDPLTMDKVTQDGKSLAVKNEGSAHFVQVAKEQKVGEVYEVSITYSGKPHVAENAPWDGGITWAKDSAGNHFIATANQGIGASIWWPCKDHQSDEPDNGAVISINVPANLVAVSNGRLKSQKKEKDKTRTFTWEVVNPINSYTINMNIGDYVSFSEKYNGEKGLLDMEYWVLRYNLSKAKIHFGDARRTMQAFEHWFGPYPFYEDSYKLVEVPYLGMEHQSSVTYGNGYQNGYKGVDLSSTGEGLKWDFIIVHESGHEWFGNNITTKDIADMWVHEGFTSYSESLFTEYHYGKEAGASYSRGLRANIENRETIVGDYEVNQSGSGDMYYKAHNMLHTLRHIVNDDAKWRGILRNLNKDFYHQIVTSQQVEEYISAKTGLALDPFFDQYLRDIRIPTLEYWAKDGRLIYRWANCLPAFTAPVDIYINGKKTRIEPTTEFQVLKLNTATTEIKVDPNYYVYSFSLY